MPLYSFLCPKCENREERVRAGKNAGKRCMCTECGVKMNRDLQADIPFVSGDYKKPIHSDSLAIAPSQRAEHLKTFPDIKLDSKNRPVFDSFGPHQAYLNKCNLVKERKKVKPKGVRIA
ncbi:zinc ribbon domain-containing protein [Candidatus Pacearchaeota archaeon]|nr:zinc ribbon domain-containing protein [Candidatus Pacearchaeota archaeon]